MKKLILLSFSLAIFSLSGFAQDKSDSAEKKPSLEKSVATKKGVDATQVKVDFAKRSIAEKQKRKIHVKKEAVNTKQRVHRLKEK